MTIAVWPAGLPPLIGLAASLGTSQLFEPAQETAMDDGPGRSRNRVLFAQTPRSIAMLLTRAEFVAFDAFVRGTLNNGAKRFSAPVRLKDGSLGTRTCRISGGVSESDLGPNSRVSFNLMIYNW